jgi:hypothetical protein
MDFDIHLGRNIYNWNPVNLTKDDLLTHVHGYGLTRSGKSKLIEYICRQLIRFQKPFCFFDRHGRSYWDLLKWMVTMKYERPIIPFNPSWIPRIVGFNPFLTEYTDEARLMTKAERLVTSTLRIWGAENPNQFSNIERWLRCIYYVILEQQRSVEDIRYFLYWKNKEERDRLTQDVRSQSIKDQLKDFYSVPEWKFKQDIESTRNKLQKFIHPQMRRVMGLPDNNIDPEAIVEHGFTLLCNFQAAEDELIGGENTRVLGTLLLSELWESFRKRKNPKEYYLIIDECDQFIGPDIQQVLNEAAKTGLHIFLFHQHEGQIKEVAGAMKNAQTKIMFSTEDFPKPQRHFVLRRANHDIIDIEVPEVNTPPVTADEMSEYLLYLTQHFMTVDEVDDRLTTSHNVSTPTKQELDPYE